jgi:branched-chain amino acid transport system ATP-binding protein
VDTGPILEVEALSKHFGGLEALKDVSLSVDRGTVTSIIGPNGAGKTTLFNCVSGLLAPTAGEVRFQGVRVTGWPPYRIASLGLSRTFQNLQLFPTLNVLENVIAARYCRSSSTFVESLTWSPRSHRERRHAVGLGVALLDQVGLIGHREALPKELPYGDQRRLEIARALATEPALLTLDEPTAGMSASEVDGIITLIGELARSGVTILLIEHNMSVVMSISDSVLVLDFGRKIAEGDPATVQRDEAVIAAYLGTDE